MGKREELWLSETEIVPRDKVIAVAYSHEPLITNPSCIKHVTKYQFKAISLGPFQFYHIDIESTIKEIWKATEIMKKKLLQSKSHRHLTHKSTMMIAKKKQHFGWHSVERNRWPPSTLHSVFVCLFFYFYLSFISMIVTAADMILVGFFLLIFISLLLGFCQSLSDGTAVGFDIIMKRKKRDFCCSILLLFGHVFFSAKEKWIWNGNGNTQITVN